MLLYLHTCEAKRLKYMDEYGTVEIKIQTCVIQFGIDLNF